MSINDKYVLENPKEISRLMDKNGEEKIDLPKQGKRGQEKVDDDDDGTH